ncbi:MAG: hypothetical protein LBF89_09995 [Bacteroidales bacterium]|nr:hypothetical protein [Bacteroidales bacterium]
MNTNQLIPDDNPEILKSMESGTINLIYLDPPFFSNRIMSIMTQKRNLPY